MDRFETFEGFIEYNEVGDYRYEFEEGVLFWRKAQDWIYINRIRVTVKFRGNGSCLLHQFIGSLPVGTGIVLNACPVDGDLSFEELQVWYMKQGFQEIGKGNLSLFYIKV